MSVEPGESHAGITVPEGDPEALRELSRTFGRTASGLAEAARSFAALPGELSDWRGPASVAFAATAAQSGAACEQATVAMASKERAAEAAAEALGAAQRDAREAIAEAKDTEARIEEAAADEKAAYDEREAALERAAIADVASKVDLFGPPSLQALADRQAALDDAEAAGERERLARHRRHRAEDDLEQAQRRGRRIEERAEELTTDLVREVVAADPTNVLDPLGMPATGIAGIAPLSPLADLGAGVGVGAPAPAADKPWYADAGGWLLGAGRDTGRWVGDQAAQVPGGVENTIDGFGAMAAQGYRGSQIARLFDRDSYDPMADPSVNPGADPMVRASEDPVGYAKRLVPWEALSRGRFGEAGGELLPGLLLGGLGGTALRATRAAPGPRAALEVRPPLAPGAPLELAPIPKLSPGTTLRVEGQVFARVDTDGKLVRVSRETGGTVIGDARQELDGAASLRDRLHPPEELRHGTPPPNVRTKRQALTEAARLAGQAFEEAGG